MKPISAILILLALYLSHGCTLINDGDKFLGKWESKKAYLTITKAGESAYTLVFEAKFTPTQYDILSPPPETCTAKLVDGNLETGTLDSLIVSCNDGKLIINGKEWEKVE